MDEGAEPAVPGGWIELALAVLMALAAVGTAWAGFQSSKWSGVQANSYAQAGAARTESNHWSTEAGQERIIDIVAFSSWLTAMDDEFLADPSAEPADIFEPGDSTVGRFLFVRFRDEFRPAMDAWLMTEPFTNQDAPTTPFEMPEYRLSADAQAQALTEQADELSARARAANQRSDNYVLTAVIFALVLFFAGVAGRAPSARVQRLLFIFAVAVLLTGVATLTTLPVTI